VELGENIGSNFLVDREAFHQKGINIVNIAIFLPRFGCKA